MVKGRIRRFLIDFPKISKTKFGTMAVNNANFMNGLDHKDVWMKDVTMDKVEAFIDNWIATHGS